MSRAGSAAAADQQRLRGSYDRFAGGSPGQKRLEGFHRLLAGMVRCCRDGTDIETELVKAQRRASLQLQGAAGWINPSDLCLNEGHPGPLAEQPQIDARSIRLVEARHQAGNHAGVQGRAGAAHQNDQRPGRAPLGLHHPAAQQQRVGVATAGQHQQLTIGCGSGGHNLGSGALRGNRATFCLSRCSTGRRHPS